MKLLTPHEYKKHALNPNIVLRVGGKPYRCECGCNVFHHPNTRADLYTCNACGCTFEAD
jgi:hypothetical protein